MSFWEKKTQSNPIPPSLLERMHDGSLLPPDDRPKVAFGEYQPAGASHLKKDADSCPECGSGNYQTIAKVATTRGMVESKRCFECGYPVVQQFSGMNSIVSGHHGVPSQPARQVPTAGGQGNIHNWHPQLISNEGYGNQAMHSKGDWTNGLVMRQSQ